MWLDHPRYIPARDRLISYLRSSSYHFRKLEPVLFLCGAAVSEPRDSLRKYLTKRVSGINLFYAERVWEQIASSGGRSALEMESDLAMLADMLVIIVESPGTFAELGAFSLSRELRKKILPIVDRKYRHDNSFISTGPLRWIDTDSIFRPTVYVSLDRILEGAEEIENRIGRIPKAHGVQITKLAESPKHLLFFLCDLISLISPTTAAEVDFYLEGIEPSILSSGISVPTLLGLGVAMNLLRTKSAVVSGQLETFYSPTGPNAVGHPYHHPRLLDMEKLRASHISVLLALPEARAVLDAVSGAS